MSIDRFAFKAARPLTAVFAACVALVLAGAQPARADAEIGSPKWAADQFKQLGLKPAAGAHGFLASVKLKGDAGRVTQVVGLLPGADGLLAKDYVLVSARLDNAGEAALIEAARAVVAGSSRPRRSIVFVLSTAEGADRRAAAPSERIVADVNLDAGADATGLALTAADETSLGRDARELASAEGLEVTRIAADAKAYGFQSQGVPTLLIGLSPRVAGADRFSAYVAALVARIAGRDERPAWTPGSRFAPPAPRAEQVLTDPVNMPLGRRPQPVAEAFG